MKVYISGKITGLDLFEAIDKFNKAALLIDGIGLQSVNPLENVDLTKTWEQHMVKDIELLLGCNAILMLDNWTESKGARIEKFIAEEMGMAIMYESIISTSSVKIKLIKDAIEEATGLAFEDYTIKSRKQSWYFARMIFVNHCIECEELTIEEVAKMVNRNITSVLRYRNSYRFEIKHNSRFRSLATKVEINLSKSVSH